MARNLQMTSIDGEKLRMYLDSNGIKLCDLSAKLKKADSYICHSIIKETMSSGTYELMCLRLGVDEDYFLKAEPEPDPEPQVATSEVSDTVVPITFDTLKRLVACEYVVDSIIKMSVLHGAIENQLFINNRALIGILRAYVPEDVERRLAELREEENNE